MTTIRRGTVIAGRYKILDPLYQSDHTKTYLVLDENTKTEQVAKFISAAYFRSQRDKEVFVEQTGRAQLFFDPGTIRVFNSGEYLEYCYLILEYVRQAVTLRMLLNSIRANKSSLTRKDIKYILGSLIDVLMANNNFFTYIKPEHVFLNSGKVRISPFNALNLTGFATLFPIKKNDLPYIPIDLFEGRNRQSALTYSLGIILYEMLSGTVPDHDIFIFSDRKNLPQIYRGFVGRSTAAYEQNRLTAIEDFSNEFKKIPPSGKASLSQDLLGGIDENDDYEPNVHYRAKYLLNGSRIFSFASTLELRNKAGFGGGGIDETIVDHEEKTVITTEDELNENLDLIRRAQKTGKDRAAYFLTLIILGLILLSTFLGLTFYNVYNKRIELKDEQIRTMLADSAAFQKEDTQRLEAIRLLQERRQMAPANKDSSDDDEVAEQGNAITIVAGASSDHSEGSNEPYPATAVSEDTGHIGSAGNTDDLSSDIEKSFDSIAADKPGFNPMTDQSNDRPSGSGATAPITPQPGLTTALLLKNCPIGMIVIEDHRSCIDMFEYPNVEGDVPINMVSIEEAHKFCQIRGKRLCNDLEWTASCQGVDKQQYPYGDKWQDQKCNIRKEQNEAGALVRSRSYRECKTEKGVHDLSGNLGEWVLLGNSGVIKGGSYKDAFFKGKCENYEVASLHEKYEHIGFRCCLDLAVKSETKRNLSDNLRKSE